MRGGRYATVGLILVIVATLVLAPLLGWTLRDVRIDLTQGHLYTLTPATLRLIDNGTTNISLTLYFSDQVSGGMPDLRNYAEHVRDTIREMVDRSHGRLQLQVVDPAPFTAAEDAAAAAGLQAVPANLSGDSIYLGLVARNRAGKQETIGFFQPDREQFLEYELAKAIASLQRTRPAVVGLVSTLPVMPHFDFASGGPVGGWLAVTQLQQTFDLRQPQLADTGSLRGLDVLVLIHPQHLTQTQLFNLDQFVLGGGHLLVFVDPNADTQAQTNPRPGVPPPDQSSDLGPLLAAWGVGYDKQQFIADARYALTVGMSDSTAPVRHVGMLGVDSAGLAHDDVVTAQLKQVNVSSAGALTPLKNATTRFMPLISSSPDAALLDAERVRVLLDPNSLAQGLQPTGKRFVIAARVSGGANTAFPSGDPTPGRQASVTPPVGKPARGNSITGKPTTGKPSTGKPTTDNSTTGKPGPGKPAPAPDTWLPPAPLTHGAIDIVVVADTDLLADLLWVQVQSFFGQSVATPFASNSDFLLNAVDHLTGSGALIGVRGRAPFQRPFVRVADLLRRADERTKQAERGLQAQLQDTERRLTQLQQGRGSSAATGNRANTFTLAQRQEIARFTQRKLAIRKALRQVKRDLTVDMERLGTTLKFINIFAAPVLLTLLLLGAALRRR